MYSIFWFNPDNTAVYRQQKLTQIGVMIDDIISDITVSDT